MSTTPTNDGGPASRPCSKCGTIIFPKHRDYRCKPCKRAQQNAKNAENPDALRDRAKSRYSANAGYWKDYAEKKKADPLYLIKRAARRKVATEIEAGRLHREPCLKCGESKTQAHHDDYSKPLQITWLCKRCHCAADAMLAARNQTTK